jgi:hypothetical protein
MSFRVWFKQWIRSFCKLMTFDYRKPRSDAQRRRERERRLKAKYSSANLYRSKKKYKKRRGRLEAQNDRLLGALFGLIGASLGILLLPLGLLDWGIKGVRARKASKSSGVAKNTTDRQKSPSVTSQPKKTTAQTAQKKTPQRPQTTPKTSITHSITKQTERINTTSIPLYEYPEPKLKPSVVETPMVTELDENTPKSTPKNEKDQYIRKRMIIAGSYYCDKVVLDALEVGSHIDLEAESDNPYDKDAVKLLFNGEKIGYIAKKDHMAFVTCLKLKRKIYGVITAIIEENGQIKYEFETWFDSIG